MRSYVSKVQGQIPDICDRLSAAFTRAVPLHPQSAKGRKRVSEKEIASATESGLKHFYAMARIERERHRLGIIGKARVAFRLQQDLLAKGYAPALVKQVLFAMLVSAFVGEKQ